MLGFKFTDGLPTHSHNKFYEKTNNPNSNNFSNILLNRSNKIKIMCNNCNGNCNECTEEVHICNQVTEPCDGCAVKDLSTDCVVFTDDSILCGETTVVAKNTILSDALKDIIDWTCTKESSSTTTLKNVGTGVEVYKGISLIGEKEIRKLKSINGSVTIELADEGNSINFAAQTTAAADGSETIIKSGSSNVTIAGAGTEDSNYIISVTEPIIPAATFQNDITVVLSAGKTLGRYINGQIIPSTGKTFEEVMIDIAQEYLNPTFPTLSITGQNNIVEVGTTLSGSKTFVWTTTNPTNITSISIFDVTGSAQLGANLTGNTLTAGRTITNKLLNTLGDTQIWELRGVNTNSQAVSPRNFTVTANYYRFYKSDVSGTAPTNSVEVRTGTTATFNDTFSISIPTGSQFAFFAYPASKPDIVNGSVFYVQGNAPVGDTFTKSLVNVLDANTATVSYKVYSVNLPVPYQGLATYNVTIPT